MKEKIIKSTRKILSGKDSEFVFKKCREADRGKIGATGIYIHIPFCRNLCPYCPYIRVPYEEGKMRSYIEVLVSEIENSPYSGADVSSVYFGGGTPLSAGKHLKEIYNAVRKRFSVNGNICIEANPNDINDIAINVMREADVSFISLGVQSFKENLLSAIGRKYSGKDVERAVGKIKSSEIDSLNIDMMFALPGETEYDLDADIEEAAKLNPDQITFYPLFTFPYSEVAQYKRMKHVKSPGLMLRRKMYYLIYDRMEERGYERCSVWSFRKKGEKRRYSSVTRERYIGFGVSAGTYNEKSFTLNTFSVDAYIDAVKARGNAVSLKSDFTTGMAKMYDFYWRLYDTYIPGERFLETLSYSLRKDPAPKFLITVMRIFRWAEKDGSGYALTRRGAMWVHFIQNMFSLNSINKIWSEGKKTAWPGRIEY